ncbi:MAG: hydantoinase/oxoprolinase family protein [Peptococcaceae bacterium]
MSYKIGIDVGGTFTDICLFNEITKEIKVFKLPTTPRDQSEAIVNGISSILSDNCVLPEEVCYLAHGTTVATNAAIERTGSRTGLITTGGFRDLLELARQTRPSLYDLQMDKPEPLVPRNLRTEVQERISYDGTVLETINAEEVREDVKKLKSAGVEAIAVCLLHSYINPEHEILIKKLVMEIFPEAYISISSEILPEYREYERLSTTTLNSYLGPVVGKYVKNFSNNVKNMGITVSPYINQSNGGLMSIGSTVESPVKTALSGPSAGVAGAAYVAGLAGFENIISLDMGGTSTDVCLIQNASPKVTTTKKVAGYPVRVPMIDVHAVGAGGGSIAWVDSGGALKVGPRSAGAMPGPVAYGRGGTEPTVTDANVVLHRLNPRYILGGRMAINEEDAYKAIKKKIADPLGLSVLDAARGIIAVVNSNMTRAIRVVSVERGYDPRDFLLMPFGGAGGLHGVELGKELGIGKIIIPGIPGILCALGLLTSDIRADFVKTQIITPEESNIAQVTEIFQKLRSEAGQWLDKEKVPPEKRQYYRHIDMRYVGQNFELPISIAGEEIDHKLLAQIVADFHGEHEREYGYSNRQARVQFVNYRITALGDVAKIELKAYSPGSGNPGGAVVETRGVYFEETKGYVESVIYDKDKLSPGVRLQGPAVIEQMDSTTVIPPGYTAKIDQYFNILITVNKQG